MKSGSWRQYYGDRLINEDEESFVMIIPKGYNEDDFIPLSCPVCGFLMRSKRDEDAYIQRKTCDLCAVDQLTLHSQKEEVISALKNRPGPNVEMKFS